MSIRHAPYAGAPPDFAIGLIPIEAADWLEGGEADPAARKDPLFETARARVWGELDGSRPGQEEVLEMVESALLLPRKAGEGDREAVEGAAAAAEPGLAPSTTLRAVPLPHRDEGGDWPPLYAAARMVPDDLCLMEKRAGAWTLSAVSLSAGTFFTADEALGKDLTALHGPVPGFEDRLLARVGRVFEGLREGLILQRRNWTVVNTGELHTPDPAPIRARIAGIEDPGRELFVRVERQTLRRLPRTGGALFTIRVWLHPLEDLRADPERLAAFGEAWRTATPQFRDYKKLHLYDPLVEAFLAS